MKNYLYMGTTINNLSSILFLFLQKIKKKQTKNEKILKMMMINKNNKIIKMFKIIIIKIKYNKVNIKIKNTKLKFAI